MFYWGGFGQKRKEESRRIIGALGGREREEGAA